jgi:predicted O-methyltransferase YrrM
VEAVFARLDAEADRTRRADSDDDDGVGAGEPTKKELLAALEGVPGWFEDGEAWALHEVVRLHPARGSGGPTVVEIGSWQGRSTIVIARALRARRSGLVHAIDPHRRTAIHESTGVEDTYAAFLANIRDAGLSDHVRPLRLRSSDARPQFADRSVDVLLVDGAHGYDDVVRDIDEWTPALADGATVAFHDVRSYGAVRRALAGSVVRFPSPFGNLRMVDELLLADFRPRGRWSPLDGLAAARLRRSWARPSRAIR